MRPLLVLAALLAAPALAQPTATVTTAADGGPGSLRAALEALNASGGGRVAFAIPGGGVHTIRLRSNLPEITAPVEIDGLTQPGAACAPWPPALRVELDGSLVDGAGPGGPAEGLVLSDSGSVVRGLAITGFSGPVEAPGAGLLLAGEGGHRVTCTFVGLRADGSEPEVGIVGTGIRITSSDNAVGGTEPGTRVVVGDTQTALAVEGPGAARNRIENVYFGTDPTGAEAVDGAAVLLGGLDNEFGSPGAGNVVTGTVSVAGTGNRVRGNRVGTSASGRRALEVEGAGGIVGVYGGGAVVGGPEPGEGNVVARSIRVVALLEPFGDVRVQGNHVGVDVDGTRAFAAAGGVAVEGAGARDVLIGGPGDAGNVIAGGLEAPSVGVRVRGAPGARVVGNWIGTDRTGTLRLAPPAIGVQLDGTPGALVGVPVAPNTIGYATAAGVHIRDAATGPSVHGNTVGANRMIGVGGLLVDLGPTPDGSTVTDPGDVDEGLNRLQNAPVVLASTVSGSRVTVTYTVDTGPNRAQYALDVHAFAVGAADGVYLGEDQFSRTDANDGLTTATFALAAPLGPELDLVLVATDADGNTGEASEPVELTPPVAAEGGLEAPAFAVVAWPNPASSRLSVRAVGAGRGARVEVLDALGRRVAGAAGAGLDVDTSTLAPGVYVVRAVSDGRVATRTVTVAR